MFGKLGIIEILDIGMLDMGYWILDAGYWILSEVNKNGVVDFNKEKEFFL